MEPITPQIPARFEIREEVYRSDQNVRLRAFDTMLEQEVILEYSGDGARELTPGANKRNNALRQARMRARVKHPRIQPLKEVIDTPEAIVHVLEPRPGDTLAAVLEESGVLSAEDALRLGIDLADAMQVLHAEGVVHRALAAPNILVNGPGELSAITGFAFAKPIEGMGQSSLTYTKSKWGESAARALPEHPAPEQLAGQAADARSDIFALGCVLYRCLTGRPAFVDAGAAWEDPVNPQFVVRETPKAFAAVVMKCLRRSPMSRYPTMLAVQEALQEVTVSSGSNSGGSGRSAWVAAAAVLVVGAAAWFTFDAFGSGSGTPGNPNRLNRPGPAGSAGPARPDERTYRPTYRKSHALLIGIDYENHLSLQPLPHTRTEIEGIGADLTALGFETPTVLLGKDATSDRIRKELDELEGRLDDEDQVFIMFSGHGDVHGSSNSTSGYVLPHDATKAPPSRGKGDNWLAVDEFTRRLEKGEYRAKHVLLAFDCCHAGAATRGAGRPVKIKDVGSGRAYKNVYLTKEAKVIMVSCSAAQLSPGNSFFADGLREKLQDALKGPVTHTELEAHIKKLGIERDFMQFPRAERVRGPSDFIFLKIK